MRQATIDTRNYIAEQLQYLPEAKASEIKALQWDLWKSGMYNEQVEVNLQNHIINMIKKPNFR